MIARLLPQPAADERWCLGLDAAQGAGVCLHCQTCAHLWRGQRGDIMYPPGRIALVPAGRGAERRVVVCALRKPLDDHGPSVAPTTRQVCGQDATPVTGGIG
jgi:hypothetical protein